MSKTWQNINLEVDGLQSANLQFIKYQKKPLTAYVLWLLFPLGLHRFYLKSVATGLLYWLLTSLALYHSITTSTSKVIFFLPIIAWAIYDVHWIRERIIVLNKALRIQIFSGQNKRQALEQNKPTVNSQTLIHEYTRIKNTEAQDRQPPSSPTNLLAEKKRIPSIAEQEQMLQAIRKKTRLP